MRDAVLCCAVQDLQDRMKKEAKKEMDERGVLQRDEAAAAKEDDEYKVKLNEDKEMSWRQLLVYHVHVSCCMFVGDKVRSTCHIFPYYTISMFCRRVMCSTCWCWLERVFSRNSISKGYCCVVREHEVSRPCIL